MAENTEKRIHFIRQLIQADLAAGTHKEVITRFPPEPNGYLHIGHAKAMCLNFGLASEFSGKCNLRFDDTNPLAEEEAFVNAIIEDVHWLGFEWSLMTHSSDYYQQFYEFAIYLIEHDKAYVDSLSMEEIRSYRGSLKEPGRDSPFRNRSCAENLDLFKRMKAGEFEEGMHVLRARIDMSSANVNLRDPVLYRIRHAFHQRTNNDWCIYPMYDYAHPVSDALEKITHSLCTLEFQDHRPLYDWFIDNLPLPAKPVQTEFARLNLSHTITSKRKLKILVDEGIVSGWDDPRLPTLCGMRRRGYPASAIRLFCEGMGISRSDSIIDMSLLENCVRDNLNKTAKRALSVIEPLKIVIENYSADKNETFNLPFNPQDPSSQTRIVPFERELYIDSNDFMQDPPKNYFRLSVGAEVRLRYAYIIRCNEAIYDEQGKVIELRCSYDEDSLGKNPTDRKVKGVIHWVCVNKSHKVTILEYDRLFNSPNPGASANFLEDLNPNSLQIKQAYCEPALAYQPEAAVFQFERLGYYAVNSLMSQEDSIEKQVSTYHRIVSLKDSW